MLFAREGERVCWGFNRTLMSYLASSIVLLACVLAVPLTLLTLPGAWLALAAAAGCEVWQPGLFSWWTIGICAGLALLGEGIEIAAGAVGASKAGGSKTGAVGAVVGTLVGAVLGTFVVPVPVIGTILGAAIGAGLGAMLAERVIKKKDAATSAKIAAGAAAGRLVAVVVKGTITLAIALTLGIAAFV